MMRGSLSLSLETNYLLTVKRNCITVCVFSIRFQQHSLDRRPSSDPRKRCIVEGTEAIVSGVANQHSLLVFHNHSKAVHRAIRRVRKTQVHTALIKMLKLLMDVLDVHLFIHDLVICVRINMRV